MRKRRAEFIQSLEYLMAKLFLLSGDCDELVSRANKQIEQRVEVIQKYFPDFKFQSAALICVLKGMITNKKVVYPIRLYVR